MVRTLLISSILALSAIVSAVPALVDDPLADIKAGWIGTKEIELDNILNGVGTVDGLEVQDNLGNARVLSDGGDGGHGGHGHGSGGGDHGLNENDYGHDPFEYGNGDNDFDNDFDYESDDNSGCGGGRGGGRGHGRGSRRPRPPHRVSRPPRVRGGCR